MAFATVCAAVLWLRRTQPDRARPFRVPLVGLVVPLGVAACLFLLASMGGYAVARILGWQVIGLGVLLLSARARR
jgi:APA family basic amino acid/polyamine antiporter